MKRYLYIFLICTLSGPLWIYFTGNIDFKADYRTAKRESAHLAPDPKEFHDAIIQVYSAKAFSWRGLFATHNWISVKPRNASSYKVYQVIGWRLYWGRSALAIETDIPDRYWYNQKPTLVLDIRGDKAEKLIPKIDAVAKLYPYPNRYEVWPGPNSNTFPAFVGRHISELGLALPANAIGKDFIPEDGVFARAPSGTGYQFSLFGILGLLIAKKEGIEVNILGLVYGIKFYPFALLLPGVGEVSFFSKT